MQKLSSDAPWTNKINNCIFLFVLHQYLTQFNAHRPSRVQQIKKSICIRNFQGILITFFRVHG